MALSSGCKVGYYSGDPKNLVGPTGDIPLLQPTLFATVPRLLNVIYGKINAGFGAATGLKKCLINKALATKTNNFNRNGTVVNGCWDKIIFKKIKAILGGQVKIMVTGSAPISSGTLDFLQIVFCCNICQGFGMTETSAGSFLQLVSDTTNGSCGGPVANVKFKVRSIPEMNHDATVDPKSGKIAGELLVAGSSVMKGYFNNPEKTQEMLPDGKWLLTGDVCRVNEDGSINIIDRVKNIFKLSQGEYIAPEKLENVFVQSPWVAQCWIHGDSFHDFVIAFVVVDPDYLKAQKGDINSEETKK